MNERTEALAKQAAEYAIEFATQDQELYIPKLMEKFAELIIRECADTIENRTIGQMGKEGEGWTNGYDDGLKTGAFLIKKHFGVE